jgi:hypothetical protein
MLQRIAGAVEVVFLAGQIVLQAEQDIAHHPLVASGRGLQGLLGKRGLEALVGNIDAAQGL